MFPVNDGLWVVYVNANTLKYSPCAVDIVGDAANPALYYYLNPDPPVTPPRDICFRMRLRCSPLKNQPGPPVLDEFVWGVQIAAPNNTILFTVQVNASGNDYVVQVKETGYSAAIVLGDNVRVINAGTSLGGDYNFYIDFKVPVSAFSGFDFDTAPYKFCYFTATQDNVFNKEYQCGPTINPPANSLCVSKAIVSGPTIVPVEVSATYVLRIDVNNCGTTVISNVVLNDSLNPYVAANFTVTLIPAAGPVFNPPNPNITWYIGTLQPNETRSLIIVATGAFNTTGQKIFDNGTVTGDGVGTIPFGDHGILVVGGNTITSSKDILSGPLEIEECTISQWVLRITIENTSDYDWNDLYVYDYLNPDFIFEAYPTLSPSIGYAYYDDETISWYIGTLPAHTTATLNMTFDGFFAVTGNQIFDFGLLVYNNRYVLSFFEDTGVNVIPTVLPNTVNVSGNILECKTNTFLDNVTITIYNDLCQQISTTIVNKKYNFDLKPGSYTLKFSKAGYYNKFMSVVINSGMDIEHDIYLIKKIVQFGSQLQPGETDIFVDKIVERIDDDIVFSNRECIVSSAEIECLSDVIDSLSTQVVCTSKLIINITIEKNVIYLVQQGKDFFYTTNPITLCIPLENVTDELDFISSYKMKDFDYCKLDNKIYNLANISFIGYFTEKQDVLVNGFEES